MRELLAACRTAGARSGRGGSCVTGYGEDLIKAAFGLDAGVIETITRITCAREITPDVSFILDIGGQDMKAIFVEHGAVTRMEINGKTFRRAAVRLIETFARSLGSGVEGFAAQACTASHPCDLGDARAPFL